MPPASSNFVIAIPKKIMGDASESAASAKLLPDSSSGDDDTSSILPGSSVQTTARTTPSGRFRELSASPFAMGNTSCRKRKLEESEMTALLPTDSVSDHSREKTASVVEISDDQSNDSDISEGTRTG
ncbi:hypothetical protein KEM54_001498, partial [Ascosphaera aggregata]